MSGVENRRKPSKLFVRWAVFMVGLVIMSFGISMMIKADLGSAPWDVLHIGLTLQLGLTVGSWSIIMGFLIIGATSFLTKEWPQLGAFINMVLVGVFIDIFLWILPAPEGFVLKLAMLLLGIIIIGYGIGLYIAPKLGAGPRDSLMLALTLRTGWKVQWVRSSMEVIVLTAGWLLGGPVFIGTLLFCFGIGSVVGFTMPQCQRMVDILIERGSKNENFNQGTLRTHHHDGVS
ncbi:YitT family protein [Alkalihalophilus pseudofirmus]|uniref:YitT family protein n=1 Tax=Alkalihalophilus pseudofirmus TaxID=79885 RepID=A0AAJ2NJW7_ALKPS|nr:MULTISPECIES: YitT family protein [Alkalihalophilus]MDV2883566.1 YitT family protein [Alkalihalophilus pseudofirmus]MED1600695.1 YitT family protein [Alkalihalophilus marmarensis]WEG17699.1 YitT family protein [Alkalihalophilus pseudofirmus]